MLLHQKNMFQADQLGNDQLQKALGQRKRRLISSTFQAERNRKVLFCILTYYPRQTAQPWEFIPKGNICL